mmetsp:Transcript_41813/g.89216  ORF Transcript_41813/g.89216 Transcript_41813/m.89216 type:complete len:80 (+) Transcript_41813:3-242(+)
MDELQFKDGAIEIKFEAGWYQGTVLERNYNVDMRDGEDEANYLVYYETDDTIVAHFLHPDDYILSDDAPEGAWRWLRGI